MGEGEVFYAVQEENVYGRSGEYSTTFRIIFLYAHNNLFGPTAFYGWTIRKIFLDVQESILLPVKLSITRLLQVRKVSFLSPNEKVVYLSKLLKIAV